MKVVLFGATGNVGSRILDEALRRDIEVVAVVRDPDKLKRDDPRLEVVKGDATAPASYADALRGGVEAVVVALSPRAGTSGDDLLQFNHDMLKLEQTCGIPRLLWIGGAGSLLTASGARVMDAADFPTQLKGEAAAMTAVVDDLRAAQTEVDWLYISPAAQMQPGKRSGQYRMGGDHLLVDANGDSAISMEDLAVAVVDQLEAPQASRERVTFAW